MLGRASNAHPNYHRARYVPVEVAHPHTGMIGRGPSHPNATGLPVLGEEEATVPTEP